MHTWTCCTLLIFGAAFCSGAPVKESNACGYDSCNPGDPSKLNVHIVSHSHNDLGYRKTVDQYFYGALNWLQHGSVQYILDSVIEALGDNPDRKFIYAEMAYLWRWWNQQSDATRKKVQDLVDSGRLEFVSGGWSMSDEASTHYSSIIDHHSLGTEFLNDMFGACGRPRVGWQIAPFGHSREHASLQAQMGLDGLFFSRTDYRDYAVRSNTKTMEMIWKASASLDSKAWLFAGLLPYQYGPPPAPLCFDYLCGDQPVMDNPQYHDYNVPERVQTFIQAAQNEASMFATNHIMMTMGNDFHYENANAWFKNMDKLIKYVNAQQANGSSVNVFYSTPSCYVYALNKANRTWSTKTDDFFPYAHHSYGFWTGLFTSRATLKGYERRANHILQVTRQLNAFSNSQLRNNIFRLSEALGVVQHLDGISGTERQEVAYDYAQRLSVGIDDAITVINQSFAKLLPKNGQSTPPPQYFCQLNNISECLPIENQARFTLTIWNPTLHPMLHYVRVPVTKEYLVRDPTGGVISTETLPISNATRNIPGRSSTATNQVIFAASLPALGFNTYFFEARTSEGTEKPKLEITGNDQCTLQNKYLRVEIDAQGNLQRVVNLQNNVIVSFSNQGFYWYQSYPGNNSQAQFQASGVYIFRPFSPTAQPVGTARTVTCIKAETVQTAIITFDNWATEEMNLYENNQFLEIEWTVGPVPIGDNAGKEIILRYDTDIQSAGKYYTDANGREVLERVRNSRLTWNYTGDEPISGNYYPVNSRIWIKDNNRQLTVLTDRSEGGASINDGSVEIMIHRRTLSDDSLGIGEALNETAFGQGLVVRGKHLLIIDQPATSALQHRVTAQNLFMHPLAMYGLPQQSYSDYSADFRQTWSAVNGTLPFNAHLLTFDQLDSKTYLLRLEHYFELNEDGNYSQPITLDLQSIFTTIGTISNAVELTLTANLPLANLQRLNWTTTEGESMKFDTPKEISLEDTSITLNPMQIRTFRVTVS